MNAIDSLTPQQLRQAANLQERILELRIELDQILGSTSMQSTTAPGKKRRLSAQGIANIRAGARKRWANFHGGNGSPSKPRSSRKMSAAGRAAISARMKKRWAAAKRAGRNAL